MLCGPAVPAAVRDWLDGTLGPEFQPAGFPATIPGLGPVVDSRRGDAGPRSRHARRLPLLAGCLAAHLRAGGGNLAPRGPGRRRPRPRRGSLPVPLRTPAHPPSRAVPAHALVDGLALEVFRARWNCRDRRGLWPRQLSDEQYAVPSHPFTVELTTRSLKAAQVRLRLPMQPVGRIATACERLLDGRGDEIRNRRKKSPEPKPRHSERARRPQIRAIKPLRETVTSWPASPGALPRRPRRPACSLRALLLNGLLLLGGITRVAHCSCLLVNVVRDSINRNEPVVSSRKKNDAS